MNGRKWHQYANNVNVYEPSYQSVGWSGTLVDTSRRRSVTIFLKGGKLHFHAPIGLSVLFGWLFGRSVRRSVGRSVINF